MRLALAAFAVAVLGAPLIRADVQVFTPGSAGVGSAINSGGKFDVIDGTYGIIGDDAYVFDFSLAAYGTGYSDAGLILGLDGRYKLGQIQSVSVNSTGAPLWINLWLDTGGDGKFFSYEPLNPGRFAALNGDTYAGCGHPTVTGLSSCFVLGGNGAGSAFSLADLQAGAVSGIDANTPAALWVGMLNGGARTADINSITVTTADAVAPVPEPGSLALLGTCVVGIAGLVRRRTRKA